MLIYTSGFPCLLAFAAMLLVYSGKFCEPLRL